MQRVGVFIGLWLALIGIGMIPLLTYSITPGKAAHPKWEWPTGTHLELAKDSPTVIMFVHPKCSCSFASLKQLQRLGAAFENKAKFYMVFELPVGADPTWAQTDLWKEAQLTPVIKRVTDEQQMEARGFGSVTSGDTFVYGPQGQLLFHGGITASRGHDGYCKGYDAVLRILLDTQHSQVSRTKTFGCGLFNS
jgi:hypothetical protein